MYIIHKITHFPACWLISASIMHRKRAVALRARKGMHMCIHNLSSHQKVVFENLMEP